MTIPRAARRLAGCTVALGLTACSATAEIGSGEFTATGADVTPRFFHRASVLADGQVIFNPANNPSKSSIWVVGVRAILTL